MTILVTGAGGFLGARIVRSLYAAGERDVRCQIREGRGADKLRAIAAEAGVAAPEIVACNLLSPDDTLRLLDGVQLVVHAAAGTRGTPADMMLNTVVATRNLLDAAVRAGTRRIALVSSFAVYRTADMKSGDLLDETSPTEEVGIAKGAYAFSKVRQEALVERYGREHGIEHVFVRPGVIYGPGSSPMSSRVGIRALGFFFSLGNGCLLPLTHVDNCADVTVAAALRGNAGGVYNAVDDELPSCAQFLRDYRARVERLRSVRVPYWALERGARWMAGYSKRSKGQLPAILTPYIVRSMYRPLRYSNRAVAAIGWTQRVSTAAGLQNFFESLQPRR